MAWNGIMCTMLAETPPPRPEDGDFVPDGWTVGYLTPVPGQDDGKTLYGCAVVAEPDMDGDAYMTWTTVRALK